MLVLRAQMIAAGRLGQKTKKGWYDYADGRTATPSAEANLHALPSATILAGPRPSSREACACAASSDTLVNTEPPRYAPTTCIVQSKAILARAFAAALQAGIPPAFIKVPSFQSKPSLTMASCVARPSPVLGHPAMLQLERDLQACDFVRLAAASDVVHTEASDVVHIKAPSVMHI